MGMTSLRDSLCSNSVVIKTKEKRFTQYPASPHPYFATKQVVTIGITCLKLLLGLFQIKTQEELLFVGDTRKNTVPNILT